MPRVLRPMLRRLRLILTGVTPAGRAALLLAVGGLLLGELAGYVEFRLLAAMLGLLLVVSLVFIALPTVVRAELDLSPAHTIAGSTSRAVLAVTNLRRIRMFRPLLIVPVTDPSGVVRSKVPVRLPVLQRGVPHRIPFTVPAPRRGVLRVGPAGARRTDPLGFFWRQAAWTASVELLVRPRMVALEPLSAGRVSDLEATPSDQISMSDLSFHALREYVRGDDLRHVHWRSSARTGQLYVRQYHDTRRSHAVVLVDDLRRSYADAAEFELALSVAASVVARAAVDGDEISLVSGPARLTGTADAALDTLARLEWAQGSDAIDPVAAAGAARSLLLGASQVFVVSGAHLDEETLSRVVAECPEDVRLLAVRAHLAADEETHQLRRPDLLEVSDLDHLPALLAAYGLQAQG